MKFLIFLLIIFYINISAQILPYSQNLSFSDSLNSTFILNTQYSLQSNSLSRKFIYYLMQNKYISKDIKDLNPLQKNFLSAYEWLNELHYFYKPDSLFGFDDIGLHSSLNYHQFSSISTYKDLLQLIMYGNKHYAGKEVNFNKSKMYYLNYGTITLGIFKNIKQNSIFNLKALFDCNFHLFKEIQYVNINKGSVYTAHDGTHINLLLNGIYQASKQYEYGTSFNTSFVFSLPSIGTDFNFSSYQLGFIKLGKNSQYAQIDTSLTFEGLEIQNILSMPTISSGLLENDSIKNYFNSFIDSNISYLRLPEIIKFSISKKWNHQVFTHTDLGMMYIFHTGQKSPEFYISQHLYLNNRTLLIVGSTLSGFSFINPFFSVMYSLPNEWTFQAYFTNPLTFVDKKYPYNASLQLTIIKNF